MKGSGTGASGRPGTRENKIDSRLAGTRVAAPGFPGKSQGADWSAGLCQAPAYARTATAFTTESTADREAQSPATRPASTEAQRGIKPATRSPNGAARTA